MTKRKTKKVCIQVSATKFNSLVSQIRSDHKKFGNIVPPRDVIEDYAKYEIEHIVEEHLH